LTTVLPVLFKYSTNAVGWWLILWFDEILFDSFYIEIKGNNKIT
jgi:hypothetical protein